jgi:acetyl esterase/lipase
VDSITKPDAAASEAVLMAGIGHNKVISVDYRMPPADHFPAALDDVVSIWREPPKTHTAKSMAVFGSSSAGRALTLPGDALRGHGRHPHFRRASFVQSGAVSRQVL